MRQTLLYIPINWIIIAWAIACVVAVFWLYRKHGWGKEVIGFLPFAAISGAIIIFGLPYLQDSEINPADPEGPRIVGLPIRGYGFFLLLATLAGVGTATYRAKSLGKDPDVILSLAFWVFIVGIVGARMFYVLQKFDEFNIHNPTEFFFAMISMTKGGLVIYGGLIGALLAFVAFMAKNRLPMFEFADIIAPSMILGLSIGRLGCLMNGCCFGGVCTIEPLAVQFPEGSPPYLRELETGELLGIHGKPGKSQQLDELGMTTVESVDAGSVADQHGIKPGDRIGITFDSEQLQLARYNVARNVVIQINRTSSNPIMIDYDELPRQSLKIHPTQVYSSIDAGLIFLFLWFFFPFRQRNGQVFALLMIIYPVARTIEEFIRIDEPGQFGTIFTISQWVSLFIFVLGLGLYVYVMLRKSEPPIGEMSAHAQAA